MDFTDQDFKTRLWDTIADIESRSGVEVVVIVKPSSADYNDAALLGGALLAFLTLSVFMFAPLVFGDYLVYTGVPTAFALGVLLVSYVPALRRLFSSAKRRRRQVEIMARALFQKGGLHRTAEGVGVLVYCSELEREVFLLADHGAMGAIPPEDWADLRASFQGVFEAGDPPARLLEVLAGSGTLFAEYLPIEPDDINEIPDDLEVSL